MWGVNEKILGVEVQYEQNVTLILYQTVLVYKFATLDNDPHRSHFANNERINIYAQQNRCFLCQKCLN